MKRFDLTSTPENIKTTLINDPINRNEDLVAFVNLINSAEDCYSIALDSQWGSGKTFFVKQAKLIFDVMNRVIHQEQNEPEIQDKWESLVKCYKNIYKSCEELTPHVTVYYDAWANDNDEDPILSLIYQIMIDSDDLSSIEIENTPKSLLGVLNKLIKAFKGIDLKEFIDEFKCDDILASIKNKKEIHKLISEFFDDIMKEKGDRLLIIIDELDRCNPQFAIKLLEQIKHYFNNDRITFVFSVNLSELEHTVHRYYGNEYDAAKYLDRFFDLRLVLPRALLPEEKELNNSLYYDITTEYLIKKYNMQMREVSKFIPMLKQSRSQATGNNFVLMTFSDVILLPIAFALKLSSPTKFNSFINGNDSTELISFITDDYVIENLYETINIILERDKKIVSNEGLTNIDIEYIESRAKKLYKDFFENHIMDEIEDYRITAVQKSFFRKIHQFQI